MTLQSLLKSKNITTYRLAKLSNIPQTTVRDLCSGKTKIGNASTDTVYKISKVLGISMESLLEMSSDEYRMDFELYKSTICHQVKDLGDLDFIIKTLKDNKIPDLFTKGWYREGFYLLAMLDYLSRENNLRIVADYDKYRSQKLHYPLYPRSAIIASELTHNDKLLKSCEKDAIPEFKRFNIMEGEVRNVY